MAAGKASSPPARPEDQRVRVLRHTRSTDDRILAVARKRRRRARDLGDRLVDEIDESLAEVAGASALLVADARAQRATYWQGIAQLTSMQAAAPMTAPWQPAPAADKHAEAHA
jgi:hypothetical protein